MRLFIILRTKFEVLTNAPKSYHAPVAFDTDDLYFIFPITPITLLFLLSHEYANMPPNHTMHLLFYASGMIFPYSVMLYFLVCFNFFYNTSFYQIFFFCLSHPPPFKSLFLSPPPDSSLYSRN